MSFFFVIFFFPTVNDKLDNKGDGILKNRIKPNKKKKKK